MECCTPEQFQEIQKLHQLWIRGAETGRRANLRRANLRGADLRGADLRGADLCGADLCDADLRGANLCDADLCGANLCDANLRRANLRGADLRRANLRGADLRGANLRGADLCGADLCDADLRGADLRGAKNHRKFISVGPLGSRNDRTHLYLDDFQVVCGCFSGSIYEFEGAVRETHGQTEFLAEYLTVIKYFRSLVN